MRSQNKIIVAILLITFIDIVGVGMLIPITPILTLPGSEFSVIPNEWTISDSYIMLGWLSASLPVAQFIASPILGQLSDRVGRKKILLISMSGLAFSYFMFAKAIDAKNIPLMFISRFAEGFFCGSISVTEAIIADISQPENRAKNFGLIGVAASLGLILGPFIGGKLADPEVIYWFNPTIPFYFITILSIISIVIALRLPETLKK